MRLLLVTSILLLLILACDPCRDCDKSLISEPTVEMIFINQDSIASIDSALLVYDSLDLSLTTVNSVLNDLRKRLSALNDSLAVGLTEYLNDQKLVLDSIKMQEERLTLLESYNIDSLESVLTTTKTTINSGLISISSIKLPAINTTLTFETDSATSWNFPLSFENKFSIYEVVIHDETFVIELAYETFFDVDIKRKIRIRAKNIQVVNTSGFNSVSICEQNCIDGEASFTFYF